MILMSCQTNNFQNHDLLIGSWQNALLYELETAAMKVHYQCIIRVLSATRGKKKI